MPRATDCKFNGQTITIADALEFAREDRRRLTCVECGERVSPHKRSTVGGAHFEHRKRNPKCSRSDPERS